MSTTTTAGRSLAIAAGIAATGGALAILLSEPFTTGAWRLDHALLPIIVAVTVAAGHLVGAAARERRWLAGFGFALIFALGTVLTVYSSVGAQKSGAAAKLAEVSAANEAVRDLRAQRDRAADALTGLKAEARRLAGVRSTSEVRAAMDATKVAKWAWTESKQCTDADALADAKVRTACQPMLTLRQEMAKAIERTDVLRKVAEAEAKAATLAGELHALGAEKITASRAKPFAEALGVLGFDRARVEVIASTFEPFAFSLLFELTAIVAFGFGFAHRRCPAPVKVPANDRPPVPAIPEKPKAPTPPKGGRRGRKADPAIVDFSEAFSRKHGRAPSGSEIRARFPALPTSTAYDYATRCRIAG